MASNCVMCLPRCRASLNLHVLNGVGEQYAAAMQRAFNSRMAMYGKQHSPVSLTHGNFLDPAQLPNEILQKVDVLFCNNVAFEPELNSQLCDRFMDMKDSAKIVSLVSFGKRKVNRKFVEPVVDHRIKVPVQKDWMFQCEGCGIKGENLDDGEAMVQCASCEVWMHMSCVGIAEHARVPKRWVCRGCCWEEQKQSRSAEQEILKVDGPYVCDVPGAVSWTSNAISYYIHTIEQSGVLHEGSEKLYQSAHAQQARTAQRKRAQLSLREHRGSAGSRGKKAAAQAKASGVGGSAAQGVQNTLVLNQATDRERAGDDAGAEGEAGGAEGEEVAGRVEAAGAEEGEAETAQSESRPRDSVAEPANPVRGTEQLPYSSQGAGPTDAANQLSNCNQETVGTQKTEDCATDRQQAVSHEGLQMAPPAAHGDSQAAPTKPVVAEGIDQQTPVADSLKSSIAEAKLGENDAAASIEPHRQVVHQAMMQWSYKEVEIIDEDL